MAARQRVVAALPTLMRALRKDAPPQRHPLPSLRRAFSIYDQIDLIDNVPEDQLRFQEIDDSGFKLMGSSMKTVQPLPDILILGCGRHIQPVDPKLCCFIRSTGMKLEAIDSRNAAQLAIY